MTAKQLLFGVCSGLMILALGSWLSVQAQAPWLFSAVGGALVMMNLLVWMMQRRRPVLQPVHVDNSSRRVR